MFEQIIYTSCCKGRRLNDGEPSGKTGGLQVYSFSKELLKRLEHISYNEIENMLATRCAWHINCAARAYAYSILADGGALWTCNHDSNPVDGARTYHFSQGYVGQFDSPVAFNMSGSNWLTDEDIRKTEGMSDIVYGMMHDYDCSTAPQADFLPLVESLPTNGNLQTHLRNLQNSFDHTTTYKNLLMCIQWLIQHSDDDRILLVTVPAKHDGVPRFDGDDTRSPENVNEAQNVSESIMWMISFLLPTAASVKIPFTVGMRYDWLKMNAGKYRIHITADEANESMSQMLAQGKTDILKWGDLNNNVGAMVSPTIYYKWIEDAVTGNPKPLIEFKNFCEQLSNVSASPILLILADIYQAQFDNSFDSTQSDTLKHWLYLLEKVDTNDWYLELRKHIVIAIYHDYGNVLQSDMRNGFKLLREIVEVSERYDNFLFEDYWTPILDQMKAMLNDTVQDYTNSFRAMLQLKNAAPNVYNNLQSYLVAQINECMNNPLGLAQADSPEREGLLDAILCRQTWQGMIGKLGFIDTMMANQQFEKNKEARLFIYKCALYGAAVNNGELCELYRAYNQSPLAVSELLIEFERHCVPPETGVKILYQALVEMIEGNPGTPDQTVFKTVKQKYPKGIDRLIDAWIRVDPYGILSICAKEMDDVELCMVIKHLMDFSKPNVIAAIIKVIPQNYPNTVNLVYQQLAQYASNTSLTHFDPNLISYYNELRRTIFNLNPICRIETLELAQSFTQNVSNPVALRRSISLWKQNYQNKSTLSAAVKSTIFDASIDIQYFTGHENDYYDLIRHVQTVVGNAIAEQGKIDPKGATFFGKGHLEPEELYRLIDLCMLLFVNISQEHKAEQPSVVGSEQSYNTLLRRWYSALPEIILFNSSELCFYLLKYIISWFDRRNTLPASVVENIRVVSESMSGLLTSPNKVSPDMWKWIMDQMRNYVKRSKDSTCETYFIWIDNQRKEKSPNKLKETQDISEKKERGKIKRIPSRIEEKKPGILQSVFGKLFSDKKDKV